MSNEIVVREQNSFIAPVVDIQSAVARYKSFKDFVKQVLIDGIDYGSIPGTDKKTLLKPGAEKLSTFFGLRPDFEEMIVVEDWTGKDHNGEPFFNYRYKCNMFRENELVGAGIGSCNSWEKKYRYRWVNEMNLPAGIDISQYEYRDGAISEFAFAVEKGETSGKYGKPAEYWQKFRDAIESGSAKKVMRKTKKGEDLDAWEIGGKLYAMPNKDVADQVNTIDKMAQKRALVAVVLITTNASDYFTQDMEDYLPDNGPVVEGSFSDNEQGPVSGPEINSQFDTDFNSPDAVKMVVLGYAEDNKASGGDEEPLKSGGMGIIVNCLQTITAPGNTDMKRHAILKFIFGVSSSKDLTPSQWRGLYRYLEPQKMESGEYGPKDPIVEKEIQNLVAFVTSNEEQMELI